MDTKENMHMSNERIKELADQEEAYAEAEYTKWTPTPDFSGVPNLREIYSSKLAELIVKECAAIVNHLSDGYAHDQFNRKMYHYHADIGKEIVDYFGVKE